MRKIARVGPRTTIRELIMLMHETNHVLADVSGVGFMLVMATGSEVAPLERFYKRRGGLRKRSARSPGGRDDRR